MIAAVMPPGTWAADGRLDFDCPRCHGPARFDPRRGEWYCISCHERGDGADLTGTVSASVPLPASLHVPPFPVFALAPVVERFVTEGAAARNIPADFIATPLLGFAGAAIGDRVVLEVKRGWIERPILWTGNVGGPGTGKSPGIDHARDALDRIQQVLFETYRQARDATPEGDPKRHHAPRLASVFTSDATLEAIASVMEASRGLAMVRDELAAWSASFDQYRRGGDRQSWLGLWSGAPLKIDRKTAPPVYVPTPVVCVVGGVQPDRLPDLRGGQADDGFPDRLLLSWPESVPIGWTDAEDDPATVADVAAVFARLHLRWEGDPVTTRFSERARAMFRRFVDDNAAALAHATGLAAGWSAKAPRHAARLALVLHCLRNPDEPERPISEATLDAAIALAEYYRGHFARCIPAMGATGTSRPSGDIGRVLRRLKQAPDWMPRSELMQVTRLPADRLGAALAALAITGEAERRTMETATKPREEWKVPSVFSGFQGISPNGAEKPEYPENTEGTYPDSGTTEVMA